MMRADRLVTLVLLLRQRGRMTATELAEELEVSTRTVQRDVEALSGAGVPVYAERGRNGGFALLPGFRTELTGLTHDEALALLVAGSRRGAGAFGLRQPLASAMLKVVDALPQPLRDTAADAAERLLVDPRTDLLARAQDDDEDLPTAVVTQVRRAVLDGRRLRLHYEAGRGPSSWRTVDPVGLVTVRGTSYLLATRDGVDRTYRLSRVRAAEVLDDLAERAPHVDLERAWVERGTRFRADGEGVVVTTVVATTRRDELVRTALALLAEEDAEQDGRVRLRVALQDRRHAEWALWRLGTDAEVLAPAWLRVVLHARAAAIAAHHGRTSS